MLRARPVQLGQRFSRERSSASFRWVLGGAVVGVALLSAAALSAGPVLHEHFEPNLREDLKFGATTASGTMPAVIQTRSGPVAAPDELASAQGAAPGSVYGGAQTPTSLDSSFHLDSRTERPDSVKYDEPFRPSILPFKRQYAVDLVRPDFSLGVADTQLTQVPVGGTAEDTEDAFFADFQVDLVPDVPVRIPSVGPGSRIRALHVDPPGPVQIVKDGAENWFARSARQGRVRMVLQITIDRQAFGTIYPPVTFEELRPELHPLPEEAKDAAAQVIEHLGLQRAPSPAHAMRVLVDYFRRFSESDARPKVDSARELYLDLSFSKKGVCRHRAFAFVVTAQALGIPARLVYNEAHAWVEVFDGRSYMRVDLGGAATQVRETRPDPTTPSHQPPPDPFSWPRDAQPGSGLASTVPRLGNPGTAPASDLDSPSLSPSRDREQAPDRWPGAAPTAADALPGALALQGSSSEPSDYRITLSLSVPELVRGTSLRVSGRATKGQKPCRIARIDLVLHSSSGSLVIGSVGTDREGYFLGQVTVPGDVPVGDHQLGAVVGAGCL